MAFTGVPRAVASRQQTLRRARLLVLGALSGPLLGLLALAVALGHRGSVAGPTPASAGHDRVVAQLAAEDLLAGRPTQVPVATGLDPYLGRDTAGAAPGPIAYYSLVWSSTRDGAIDGEGYETDAFVVERSDGLWLLTVEVLDGPAGPVIGADPSLAPDPAAPSSTTPPLAYANGAGGAPAVLPGAVDARLQAWAVAYVGGRPGVLYGLTGDTGPDHFSTLEGWVLDGCRVSGATVRGASALARLSVTMHLAADPADHVTSAYDVLVTGLAQAAPLVQAWGPPGSGPGLVPLADAIPGH